MLQINPLLRNPFKKARVYADGRRKIDLDGPLCWVLVQLMDAGPLGCTPGGLKAALPGFWMPPLSQLIHRLRKAGVVIETVRTNAPDTGGGLNLRYVLRSEIAITAVELV